MANEVVALVSRSDSPSSDLGAELVKDGFEVTVFPDHIRVSKDARCVVVLTASSPDDLGRCRKLCEDLRAPILVLTNGGEKERVQAFRAGADDAMTMPVNRDEFVARVRALFRRLAPAEEGEKGDNTRPIALGDLCIDPEHHSVKLAGSEIELTLREFNLLLFLARNRGYVFSREKLLREVWSDSRTTNARTVDTHICRLRKKLESYPGWQNRLVSVKGFGYKLRE